MPNGTPAERWEKLSDAVQRLGSATNMEEAVEVLRTGSRDIAGSDGVTIVRREGDETVYIAEDAISPHWVGRRFPISECLAGFAITQRRPVIIPDVRIADNVPQNLYMATFVESVAVFPVGLGEPIGAIGAYWKHARAIDDETVSLLAALARAFGAVIETLAVLDQSRAAQSRLARAAS